MCDDKSDRCLQKVLVNDSDARVNDEKTLRNPVACVENNTAIPIQSSPQENVALHQKQDVDEKQGSGEGPTTNVDVDTVNALEKATATDPGARKPKRKASSLYEESTRSAAVVATEPDLTVTSETGVTTQEMQGTEAWVDGDASWVIPATNAPSESRFKYRYSKGLNTHTPTECQL